jgi:hypothetical protein
MSPFELRRQANMATNKALLAEIKPLALPVEKKTLAPRKEKVVVEQSRFSDRQKEARAAAAAAAAALAEKGEEVGDGMLLLGYVGRIELTFCRLWRGGD